MLIFVVVLYLGLFYDVEAGSEEELNRYEGIVESSLRKADEFQIPTDACMYKPSTGAEAINDFGSFDFVIIGAGATGTVIANRLSEIEKWKILLLEAGTAGDDFTDIPAYGFPSMFSNFNWGYYSVPQSTACQGTINKTCPFPRGKGIGGTTLINGLAYARGNRIDYDRWANMGNPGWSYDEVLPYFKKSENFEKTDPVAPVDVEYHGENGYLNVEYHQPRSPQLNAFLDARLELGFQLTDYNGREQIGVSPMQVNTKHGRRADGGSAFIKPILKRENLKIMTESYVIKIHVDRESKKVIGVHFTHKGKTYMARVGKEAILSAGAIASPHILMLSGIGPKSHLDSFNIPLVQDLDVGSTLRDQSQYFGLSFSSNSSRPVKSLKEYLREFLMGDGPLAIGGNNEGVGFFQTSVETTPNYPDLEMVIVTPNATSKYSDRLFNWDPEVYESIWGGIDIDSSFMIYLINLHQKSVGSVRLKSSSPYDYPLINANFLSDPENHDSRVLYEGIQLALKLQQTKAFKKINAKLQVKPLPACRKYKPWSEKYWYCSLQYLTFDDYHPMGTCPMGPDPQHGAVVNSNLKVYGIQNLRVADASVFPQTPSGHPNAPCVMVGEKASDLIKRDYRLT